MVVRTEIRRSADSRSRLGIARAVPVQYATARQLLATVSERKGMSAASAGRASQKVLTATNRRTIERRGQLWFPFSYGSRALTREPKPPHPSTAEENTGTHD